MLKTFSALATQVISSLTGGLVQFTGPASGTIRTITVPNANATMARTDAAQSFTGDQTLSTGNLVIGTAGKGIDFSATPGTGTSELLNDYEEGAWTPTLVASTTDFTSVSYFGGAVEGRYTKVGNLVTVQGSMRTTAITVGAAAGDLCIGGLPFAAANVPFSDSVANIGDAASFNVNQPSTGLVSGNTTRVTLRYRSLANGSPANMGFAEANTGYNVNILNFSATYRV